jgi:hypothetical protein
MSETDMMLARLSDRAVRARRLPTWHWRQISRKAARVRRRKETSGRHRATAGLASGLPTRAGRAVLASRSRILNHPGASMWSRTKQDGPRLSRPSSA